MQRSKLYKTAILAVSLCLPLIACGAGQLTNAEAKKIILANARKGCAQIDSVSLSYERLFPTFEVDVNLGVNDPKYQSVLKLYQWTRENIMANSSYNLVSTRNWGDLGKARVYRHSVKGVPSEITLNDGDGFRRMGNGLHREFETQLLFCAQIASDVQILDITHGQKSALVIYKIVNELTPIAAALNKERLREVPFSLSAPTDARVALQRLDASGWRIVSY